MRISYCLLIALTLAFAAGATAQISGFLVNGSSSSFTMTSGDTIRWEYNISPAGASVNAEIWYDIDQNGVINPSTDKVFFAFRQTDGDTLGNGGPPDMDRLVNGMVFFRQHVGLAPGKYIMRISYNSDVHQITGTVNPLPSPAHTISGTVIPPSGKSAQYVFLQADRNENYEPNFWDAITDAAGNYTIAMSADTAGNPWRIHFADGYNPFPPSIATPSDITLTVSATSYTGQDFSFQAASAQVAGFVHDELGNPALQTDVGAFRDDGLVFRSARTNGLGFYQIGILSSDLNGQTWHVQIEANGGENYLTSEKAIPAINLNDSIPVNLVAYTANAQITGTVTIMGFPPGIPLQVFAANPDSAQVWTFSDGSTGAYTLPVSNKIYNYDVYIANLPSDYSAPTIQAHPGNSGVDIDITITSVKERAPGLPGRFALKQNYPNPFNPSTSIDYDIASASRVQLVVYDILGREVERIVNKEQPAGKYTATFDGSHLSSGLYFYRLQTGTYTKTMKLLLMK